MNKLKYKTLLGFIIIGLLTTSKSAISAVQFNLTSHNDSIKKAKTLVKQKKYSSAFTVLANTDPDRNDPDVVLLEEDIVLNYFIESMNHEMFSLKDLKENESVEDYRGKEGTSDMFVFDAAKILNRLIKQNAVNGNLYKGLADYYESAYDHYGSHWTIGEDSLNDLIRNNYQMAINRGVVDAHAYFRIGVSLIQDDKAYRKGILYLKKSYQLDSSLADCGYNLAYAYLYCDSRDTALHYAKLSEARYKDPTMKGDAQRMIGEIYIEMNDTANSIKYYAIANNTQPENYYNIKSLLSLYVATGNLKRIDMTNEFFKLDPKNPTIYNDLSEMYSDSLKGLELMKFFKNKLPLYNDKPKILGTLYFYLANLLLHYDKNAAKDYASKARDTFSKIFEKDNAVFGQLDKILEMANDTSSSKKE